MMLWGVEVIAAIVGSGVTLLLGWLGLRDQRHRWMAETQAAQDAALDRREASLRADFQAIFDRLDAENRRQNAELLESRTRAGANERDLMEKSQRIIDLITDRASAMHQHALAQEAFLLERQKNIALAEQFGRRLSDSPAGQAGGGDV